MLNPIIAGSKNVSTDSIDTKSRPADPSLNQSFHLGASLNQGNIPQVHPNTQNQVSNPSMDNDHIIYEIHIATTTEEVWKAITDPASLLQNWGAIESKWSVGSTVSEVDGGGLLLWKGRVLQSEFPYLLSYTFDVIGSGEPATVVTFELGPPITTTAPNSNVVKLRLTQLGFQADSKLFSGCLRAWPEILSSLKTYLETGRPLQFLWKH